MNDWFPQFGAEVSGASSDRTEYTLSRTYYQELPSSVIDESNIKDVFDVGSVSPWDRERFKAWLAEDEGFKAAYPNWEDCAFWNSGKLPVDFKTQRTVNEWMFSHG